ncbi:MAG: hypothetical protein ACYSUC_13055 [Planctomycetota bacterium]
MSFSYDSYFLVIIQTLANCCDSSVDGKIILNDYIFDIFQGIPPKTRYLLFGPNDRSPLFGLPRPRFCLQGPEHKSCVRPFVTHRNGKDIYLLWLVLGGIVSVTDGSVVKRNRQLHGFRRESLQFHIEERILARRELKARNPPHEPGVRSCS